MSSEVVEKKPRTITTCIRIDPEVFKIAKHKAVDLGIPVSTLISQAVKAYIEQLEKGD